MTVRKKIALLITAAGFLSSLVFSCIILWEIAEQPYRILDADLSAAAHRTVDMVSRNEKHLKKGDDTSAFPLYEGNYHYWVKIYDSDTGALIYRSILADLIDIPEAAQSSGKSVSVIVPQNKIDLKQDRYNEVTFRVKKFIIPVNGKIFTVNVGRPMEKLEEEMWDIFIGVGSGLAFSLLVLMALSYFVAGIILKPVKQINDQARDITEKHLDCRIPVRGEPDEFNDLARTLNHVFERLQYAFNRQKQLLADASHELKTPLTMMRLALDKAGPSMDHSPSYLKGEDMVWLKEQVLRMERLIKNLLDLSSLEMEKTIKKDQVDLGGLLESLIEDYRFLADPDHIQIKVSLPDDFLILGDDEKLTRAFSNILDNAIKYNVEEGKIKVVGSQSNDGVNIIISNTGEGVIATKIDKVFDQFYRVEVSRSLQYGGYGLGLAIAKEIIDLHQGNIKFESIPSAWTQVSVFLPRHGKKGL